MSKDEELSYIDYEAFLDPTFSATSVANTLVLATNNASDTPLDLSTPLSRVLFDVQEVDTHIDTLTTKSAVPLLQYTRHHAEASEHILRQIQRQVASLTESYQTLEREVIERHAAAEQVRIVAERLCETINLGRAVARCLMLGRQLEARMSELGGVGSARKEDHRAMVRSADTVLSLRQVFAQGMDRFEVVKTLKTDLVQPGERSIALRAQQIIKEFAVSALPSSAGQTSASTFAQTEEIKARTTSALLTLYLLSPIPSTKDIANMLEPKLMITALQDYLHAQVKVSLTSLVRSLGQLPTLDKTLVEISARCQNLAALQSLLEATKPPQHSLLEALPIRHNENITNLLQPALHALDTSSLPSFFWRSLAQNLLPKVQELMQRGGVAARTLKSNKERVRDMVRECVNRGSQWPSTLSSKTGGAVGVGSEREAAVMVGSILGAIK